MHTDMWGNISSTVWVLDLISSVALEYSYVLERVQKGLDSSTGSSQLEKITWQSCFIILQSGDKILRRANL